jgi:hypothetical protein
VIETLMVPVSAGSGAAVVVEELPFPQPAARAITTIDSAARFHGIFIVPSPETLKR